MGYQRVKSIVSRAAAVLLAVLFCFCGVSCGKPSAAPDAAAGEIVFTDALGREIRLSAAPERTASLLGSFADIWMLAGGDLCAAAEDAWEDFGLPLDGAVCIGGAHSPNTELLFASEPDFVLASAATASHVELRGLLEAAGITVAYFHVECFDDYLQMLAVCTEITGRADLWEQNGQRLREEVDAIRTRFSGAEAPAVLLLRASTTTVKAKGSDGTVLGEMLADLGCRNLADSDTSLLENLSVEAVIAGEPRHIFIVAMGGNTETAMQSVENLIASHPAWQTLDAVQNGRMHIMDRSLFHLKPNARWAEAYQILYEILINE
ncbi:MAG: ABC transporter substrate-binding protein [Ruminococcaceae bacterium]|nr:ABC transporter substrate-binding protein [Oscillospiraceae bacterium]